MKKISLLLLVMALVFVFASAAMAEISFDKDTKILTVTMTEDTSVGEVFVNDDLVTSLNPSRKSATIDMSSKKDGSYKVDLLYTDLLKKETKYITIGATETDAPTTAPVVTDKPTDAPTDTPTGAPTDKPTDEPTSAPQGPMTVSSVSYKGQKVTFTASGVKYPAEVYLDDSFAGLAVNSNGTYTISTKLTEGSHTLYLFSPTNKELSNTATFTVKFLKPQVSNASYADGKVTFTVGNNDTYVEVYIDDAFTGQGVTGEGTFTITKTLAHGSHTLYVFNADGVLQSNTVTFEAHMPVEIPGKLPTCTEDGSTAGSKCSVCDKILVEPKVLKAPGHTPKTDAAVEPTCTKTGLSEGKSCLICGEVIVAQQVLPALGHDTEVLAAKEPTCTETGLSEGKKCKRCGEIVLAQEVLAALGHDAETVPAVEATCTATGLTEGSKCKRCGAELTAQQTVPALGHKYVVVERTAFSAVYKCERCGDTFTLTNDKPVKNAFGNIVKDATGKDVDYTALAAGKNVDIVADLKTATTTEVGLYLSEELIAQLQKQGAETVTFVNGDAKIVIKLADIKAAWFTTDSAIWNYVFSTDPAENTLVKVEAQISGTEKVAANEFSGVTLKKADGDVEITANGIY